MSEKMWLLTSITAYQRTNSWVMMAEVDGLGLEKGSSPKTH